MVDLTRPKSVQTFLDVGQAGIEFTECPVCKTVYTKGKDDAMHRRKHAAFLKNLQPAPTPTPVKKLITWPGISRLESREALSNGDHVVPLVGLVARDWRRVATFFKTMWVEAHRSPPSAVPGPENGFVLLYVRPKLDAILGLIWVESGLFEAHPLEVDENLDVQGLEVATETRVVCPCVVRFVWVHPRARGQKVASLLKARAL